MPDKKRDPEMGRLAEELSTTLSELRDELDERNRPRRGPLGFPRPPKPGELLEFTDEFAIPAVIAILEANIRALEAFRGAVRLARAGDEAGRRGREARARTEELSRGALDRLDDTLADLQNALEGQPQNAEARTLLDDARALRAEIDDRLGEANRHSDDTGGESDSDWKADETGESDDTAPESVTIDVDSELDSIRDEVGEDSEDDEDDDPEDE